MARVCLPSCRGMFLKCKLFRIHDFLEDCLAGFRRESADHAHLQQWRLQWQVAAHLVKSYMWWRPVLLHMSRHSTCWAPQDHTAVCPQAFLLGVSWSRLKISGTCMEKSGHWGCLQLGLTIWTTWSSSRFTLLCHRKFVIRFGHPAVPAEVEIHQVCLKRLTGDGGQDSRSSTFHQHVFRISALSQKVFCIQTLPWTPCRSLREFNVII